MAAERNIGLPLSIVAGSSIIAVGLYLGLRAQPPVSAAPAAPPAPVVEVAEPKPMPAPQAPAGPSVPDRVYRQAQAALDALQPELSRICWTPPPAGEPDAIELTYDVTFGPDGGILMLGISDLRAAFRTSVSECIRRQPRPVLPVDPPGEPVRVMLPLQLP